MTLVLASTSPRRYQILSLLHLPFLMVSPNVTEVRAASRSAAQEVLHQAHRKAASLATRWPEAVVIGSDTLISLAGESIGKPADEADARAILTQLRGRTHAVVTAVALHRKGGEEIYEAVETACVRMREFSDGELDAYLKRGESLDKAGAYAVQGAGCDLIAGLEGDYLAVVGLPLRALVDGLRQWGIPVALDVDRLYRERACLNWRTFDA